MASTKPLLPDRTTFLDDPRKMHIAYITCACADISATFHSGVKHIICHCEGCRNMTGGMFSQTILIHESHITHSQGDIAKATFRTFGMGEVEKYYCKKCTSPLWLKQKDKPGTARVFVGALREQEWVEDNKPVEELCIRNRCDWLPNLVQAAQEAGTQQGAQPAGCELS